MGSPSYQARVGWMTLTSLPESKRANMDTDFFRKMTGYRMHGTRVRFRYLPLFSFPPLPTSVVSTALAVPTTSSLVSVTGVKVVETDTSFLTLSFDSDSGNTCSSNVSSHDKWSIWPWRCLSLLSWRRWRWLPLQRSRGYNLVLVSPLGAENLLAGGPSPSLGWRRKSAEWKMTVSH